MDGARGASLFRALRQGGAEENLAFTATQEVVEMAGHNIAALLGAHKTELAAKFDAQKAELTTLRWMLMAVLALLAALTALGIINLRTAAAPASPVTVQVVPAEAQDAVPAQPINVPTP